MHLQSVKATLGDIEVELAGQDEQAAVPGTCLNFPSAHNSHGPPSGPNDPGEHSKEQSSTESLPGIDVGLSDGQSLHTAADFAPTIEAYVPAAQLLHSDAPEYATYLPP